MKKYNTALTEYINYQLRECLGVVPEDIPQQEFEAIVQKLGKKREAERRERERRRHRRGGNK